MRSMLTSRALVASSSTLGLTLLMKLILHYLKDPKLWDFLWYIPYYGQCWIYIINNGLV